LQAINVDFDVEHQQRIIFLHSSGATEKYEQTDTVIKCLDNSRGECNMLIGGWRIFNVEEPHKYYFSTNNFNP
jgi:hypothetical protein